MLKILNFFRTILVRVQRKFEFYAAKNLIKIYNKIINPTCRIQRKNTKNIPIIILSYNQLNHIIRLIDFLLRCGYKNITIFDNASTYPPLLDYYKKIESIVDIYYNKKNDGHMAFWANNDFQSKIDGYYIVTDPDVIPVLECPINFVDYMLEILETSSNIHKVGLSLKLDDIPDTNPHKHKILNWESKFWWNKTEKGDFFAEIDTTFALYRPLNELRFYNFYTGIRLKFPYQARHLGWYVDPFNLTEEQKYYYKTANNSSSWKTDSKGNLLNKMY